MGKKYIEFGHSFSQMAGVYCEERIGVGDEERINPFEIRRRNGVLNFEIDSKMQFAEAEKRGVENMLGLAKDFGLIFWFSPPGGEYVSGRAVVARVAEVCGEDIALECRGLVVEENQEAMMEMAEKILREGGVSMDGIENPEDLRSQPIGINLEAESWIDFGNRMLGMETVWKAISKGEDVKNKRRIEIEVVEVMGEIGKRGIKNNREWWLERLMGQRGYWLNPVGNHGGSVLMKRDLAGDFKVQYSQGRIVTAETPGAKRCKKCGAWHLGKKCPFC